jgi:glycolate dehydrogenase FAD-binding subunit
LWRLALPYDASYPELDGDWLTEWGGAQRWLVSDGEAATIERAARGCGGYAQCFSTGGGLATVDPVLHRYHARLKAAFDPHGLLNLGRMPAAR